MVVPFMSLREQTQALRPQMLEALSKVVDTQGFANGPAVAQFEKDLAAWLGAGHVVAVNSGTTALHAALIVAGVKRGDEVITVSHTWISTAWAISYVGATPVFADIEQATCGMDPLDLERRVTGKTRAIIPVHLYGSPVDLAPILAIANQRGIPVIEDCAQSIGARYKGRQTGTFGRVNATSFYPGKNLGAYGEGGAVMTDDAALADRVRRLRDHAQEGRHNHVELGFNWRMDGFQGAVLSVKLQHLNDWNARRRQIAARYRAGLAGARLLSSLAGHPEAELIWHIFPVFHPQRDELRRRLEDKGVQTGVHYPTPVHLQPAYAHLAVRAGSLPVAESAAATEVSLPMYPELTDDAVEHVIASVIEVCRDLAP